MHHGNIEFRPIRETHVNQVDDTLKIWNKNSLSMKLDSGLREFVSIFLRDFQCRDLMFIVFSSISLAKLKKIQTLAKIMVCLNGKAF